MVVTDCWIFCLDPDEQLVKSFRSQNRHEENSTSTWKYKLRVKLHHDMEMWMGAVLINENSTMIYGYGTVCIM